MVSAAAGSLEGAEAGVAPGRASGFCGPPMPICTGLAAPRLVPGAMAAIWLA
ncbi:hypothetical protein D3C81_1397550 [compost metagenome]